MPGMDERFLSFNQFHKLEPCPFVIYADTEAINHPVTKIDTDDISTLPDATNATEVIQEHKPCGYAYIIVPRPEYEGKLPANLPFSLQIQSGIGAGSMEDFMKSLMRDCRAIEEWLRSEAANVDEVYKNDDGEIVDPLVKKALRDATKCRFCQMPLPSPDVDPEDLKETGRFSDRRVADHDHITGEFRGVAHDRCNRQASALKRFRVPVLFHNLKGYDGYHVIHALARLDGAKKRLKVIAKSMESYTSFTYNEEGLHMIFLDTNQFLKGRLADHVRNLYNSFKGGDVMLQRMKAFRHVLRWEPVRSTVYTVPSDPTRKESEGFLPDFERLTKKGVYPYEFAKKIDDLFVAKELPPKEAFKDTLNGGKGISDGEYRRAQWAWKYFDCQDMAQYTLRYCELDVLLLASIFETFRYGAVAQLEARRAITRWS
jgi:hypothetical protein